MSHPVFLTDAPLDPTLAAYELTGSEARHAVVVRRIHPGEVIDIVDGAGVRLRGAVTTAAASPRP